MTYKELYLKEHPEDRDRIDEVMKFYCPTDPSTGETIMCNYTSISRNLRCRVCWNQEIHETCSCYDFETDRCNGTKERDECSCGGDETKCDFYPEKRAKAAEKSEIQKTVEKIQECGFKAKELVPVGEEVAKGLEKGILEPKTSVNLDGAEFQKKVYEAFGIPEFKSLTHEEILEYRNTLYEELLKKQGGLFKDVAEKRMELDKEDLEEIDNDILKEMIKSDEKEPSIKDSGTRREFSTGAVRDIQEGKGRCDLMPLDVIAEHMEDSILLFIYQFTTNGNVGHLYRVLDECPARLEMVVRPTVYLEVAKHFEAGAAKYGEWNWQKGIPTHCYIDSAVRHYLKYLRGDKDEAHNRAFVWNILCCIWTCKHKPELNDYPRKEEKSDAT